MQKKFDRFLSSPLLIIFFLFLLPPLGLILLGSSQRISTFSKWFTGISLSILVLLFLMQYQWQERLPTADKIGQENLRYELISIEYPEEVPNSINEIVKAKKEFHLVKLNFTVENQGSQSLFYASLIDQPELITPEGSYPPDLTMSKDPFGNLIPDKVSSGYFIFQVPEKEQAIEFNIGSQKFSLNP